MDGKYQFLDSTQSLFHTPTPPMLSSSHSPPSASGDLVSSLLSSDSATNFMTEGSIGLDISTTFANSISSSMMTTATVTTDQPDWGNLDFLLGAETIPTPKSLMNTPSSFILSPAVPGAKSYSASASSFAAPSSVAVQQQDIQQFHPGTSTGASGMSGALTSHAYSKAHAQSSYIASISQSHERVHSQTFSSSLPPHFSASASYLPATVPVTSVPTSSRYLPPDPSFTVPSYVPPLIPFNFEEFLPSLPASMTPAPARSMPMSMTSTTMGTGMGMCMGPAQYQMTAQSPSQVQTSMPTGTQYLPSAHYSMDLVGARRASNSGYYVSPLRPDSTGATMGGPHYADPRAVFGAVSDSGDMAAVKREGSRYGSPMETSGEERYSKVRRVSGGSGVANGRDDMWGYPPSNGGYPRSGSWNVNAASRSQYGHLPGAERRMEVDDLDVEANRGQQAAWLMKQQRDRDTSMSLNVDTRRSNDIPHERRQSVSSATTSPTQHRRPSISPPVPSQPPHPPPSPQPPPISRHVTSVLNHFTSSPTSYARLLSELADLLLVINESGSIMWAGGACERLVGFEASELLGREMGECVHPGCRGTVKRCLEGLVGEGGGGGEEGSCVVRFLRGGGNNALGGEGEGAKGTPYPPSNDDKNEPTRPSSNQANGTVPSTTTTTSTNRNPAPPDTWTLLEFSLRLSTDPKHPSRRFILCSGREVAGKKNGMSTAVDEVLDLRIRNLRLRMVVDGMRRCGEDLGDVDLGELGLVEDDDSGAGGEGVERIRGGGEGRGREVVEEDGEESSEGSDDSHPFLSNQRYAHLVDFKNRGRETDLRGKGVGMENCGGGGGGGRTSPGLDGEDGSGGEKRRKVSGGVVAVAAEWVGDSGGGDGGVEEDCEDGSGSPRKRKGRGEGGSDGGEVGKGGGVTGKRKKKAKLLPPDLFCRQCGTTRSPEWRKGPDGPKTLCNACGLAYAKKQKKVG
ncbi:blue light receptor [Rhizophlyctis rosea]|nr:blue light receptor [Rhizophlyctis rosea]